MISVLPCKDKEKAEKLFKKHSLPFNEFSFCVIAESGGENLGYCLFELNDKQITVLDIEPKNDIALADGILRSALHNGICAKVIRACYSDSSPEELFEKLGFVLDKKEKTLDISKLFKSCCSCKE